MKRYGELPKVIGKVVALCNEMMFYQYMPIKLAGTGAQPVYEPRLAVFSEVIDKACVNFKKYFGHSAYVNSHIYLTAKNQYQRPGKTFNRPGYHSDGFLTSDINYIWYDHSPTVFNKSRFVLTLDDTVSLREMAEQALRQNEVTYPEFSILRLNQYNIHKVADNPEFFGFRTFVKISFSKDRYDLLGNTHNFHIDYDWPMVPRKHERNIPQSIIQK